MSSRLVIGVASALGAGFRLEQRLVEVGQLQLVAADPPDAFLAEGVEGRELVVGHAPGGGDRRRRPVPAFGAVAVFVGFADFDAVGCFAFGGSFGIDGASASAARTAVVVATAVSRATVDGSRPASTPLNADWRTIPSRDQPPSSARITSSGRTQVMPRRSPPQRPR